MREEQGRLSDHEVVYGYRDGSVLGQAVMRRLIQKCEKPPEIADEVIKKADGSAATGPEGKPLNVDQYFSIADQHPGAVDTILGFILLDESDPRFPGAKLAINTWFDGYLGRAD